MAKGDNHGVHPVGREKLRDWRTPLQVDGPAATTAAQAHIVVGFDAHPAGHAALAKAIDLGRRLDAFLHVAHTVDIEDQPVDPDSADWEERISDTVERERADACAMLAETAGNWTYYSREGDAAQLLIALADRNDALMIVIGAARGGLMSFLDRFLGESVSASLVHRAHTAVLVVPPPT